MSEKGPRKARKTSPKRSAKPRKTKAKEPEEEVKTPPSRADLGPSPRAMVESRHRFSMQVREARGFSLAELESAGIPRGGVRRLGIPLDIRRRTALDQNVEKLRGWYGERRQKDAQEPVGKAGGGSAKRRKRSEGEKKADRRIRSHPS